MSRFFFLLSVIIFIFLTISTSAVDSSLRETVDNYRNKITDRALEARKARQEWEANPTVANMEKHNRLMKETMRLFKHLISMEDAIKKADEADNELGWGVAFVFNSVISDLNAIGGTIYNVGYWVGDKVEWLINPVVNWVLGTNDTDIYGPNWQLINEKYNGMSQKYKDILLRKAALKKKPYDEAAALAIKKEMEEMKQKYEILRQMIRVEQRNIGFANTVWGEEYFARHFNAIFENFDWAGVMIDIMWGNPKAIYTAIRPGMLLKISDSYINPPNGYLTPKIADSIVLDVMGVSPTRGASAETWENFKGNCMQDAGSLVAETLQQRMAKCYAEKGAAQFAKMQNLLMHDVKLRLTQQMESEIQVIIRNMPYEKLPINAAPGQLAKALKDYFARRLTRDNAIAMAKKTMTDSLKRCTETSRQGFIAKAVSATNTGQLMASLGTLMDLQAELMNSGATMPSTYVALDAANMEARLIRQQYRKLTTTKPPVIDSYEQTEDEYLNAVWGTKWKYISETSKEPLKEALAADKKAQDARKALLNEKHIAEDLNKKITPDKDGKLPNPGDTYSPSPDLVVAYRTAVTELEKQMEKGEISANEFVKAEADAIGMASGEIAAKRAFNKAVYEHKTEKWTAYVDFNKPNEELKQEYKMYKTISELVDKAEKDLGEERTKWLTSWMTRAKTAIEKMQKYNKQDEDLQTDIAKSILAYSPVNDTKIAGLLAKRQKGEDDRIAIGKQISEINHIDFTWDLLIKNIENIVPAVRNIADAEESLQIEVPKYEDNIDSESSKYWSAYAPLIDDLDADIKKEGVWADLAINPQFYQIIRWDDYNRTLKLMPETPEQTSPLKIMDQLNKHYLDITAKSDSVKDCVNNLPTYADSLQLRSWCDQIITYTTAIKKYATLRNAVYRAHDDWRNTVIESKVTDIINGEFNKVDKEKFLLANLSAQFTSKPVGEYLKPKIETALWVNRGMKVTIKELKEQLKTYIAPDAVRISIGELETQLDNLNIASEKLDPQLSNGYSAISSTTFPGMGTFLILDNGRKRFALPDSVEPVVNIDEYYQTNHALLRKLSNLEKGIDDLIPLIEKLTENQNAFIAAVKQFHRTSLDLNAVEYGKAEKLLTEKKWKEAQTVMESLKIKYPAYPTMTVGATIDNTSVNDLGLSEEYKANNTRRDAILAKIKQLEEESKINPGGDDPNINTKINEFYQSFKAAYESRNEMKLLSYLSDNWTAGDGTDLGDITTTLRNSFAMYDQVKFIIGPLNIQKVPVGYRVTYDVTITGKNLENDIKHEEKSTVTEDVNIDTKGKIKILKTLTGRFWYVD